jgi:hypothetical protein
VARTQNGPVALKPMNLGMTSKVMRLKLSGNIWEVSERRQVGDAEEMLSDASNRYVWWKNGGMEEGM